MYWPVYMNKKYWLLILIALPFFTRAQSVFSLGEASKSLPHLNGKKENANYLCVTAGDRLYSIGDQAGNFPAVGFHIPGEMGGIWQHPIKLMDGFHLSITDHKTGIGQTLDECDRFISYSFTSQFLYSIPKLHLSVSRTQFVPDGMPLVVIEYVMTNNDHA